jgi:hypothetical protein
MSMRNCRALSLSVALACGSPQTRGVELVSAHPATSASTAASTSEPAPIASKFCVPAAFREARLELAQPGGDDYIVCTSAPHVCVAIDRAANYRAYHGKPSQPAPPAPSGGFYNTSTAGRLTFELVGGERTPHGARGTLREVATKRVLKSAPIDYDEHLDYLGWIGDGIVLSTRVDEGPGCELFLYQPLKTWPPKIDDFVDLGGCYGGNVMLAPALGVLAIVDASGSNIKLVDELTLAIDTLEIGHDADADSGTRIVAWLENGDSVLVLAYGSPISGDVARIDVKRRKILSVSSPDVCK